MISVGYYISGNVTVKVTEEQEVLLALRQQDLIDQLHAAFKGSRFNVAGLSVKDMILDLAGIEADDYLSDDEDEGEGYSIVIKGYPPEKLRDTLPITLRWVAESGGSVFAKLSGEDGYNWVWETNPETFTLDEIALENYPLDKIMLVEKLARTYEENPALWDDTPAEVAAILKGLL